MEFMHFDPSTLVNVFFKSCYPHKSAMKTSLFKTFDESIDLLLFVSINVMLLPNMRPVEWGAQETTLD